VLVGPEPYAEDPLLVTLARAHRAGIVTVQATGRARLARAGARYGAVGLRREKTAGEFTVFGSWGG
jgi:hypothetical protein